MPMSERRRGVAPNSLQLHAQLNEAQLRMVHELECFGWDLRFVRRWPFRPPMPVLFAGEDAFLCLRADGTMDETPPIEIRHDHTHH